MIPTICRAEVDLPDILYDTSMYLVIVATFINIDHMIEEMFY